ncbi:SapC family protein [Sphingomonas sp. JC676]|uniref:SapC family protein n=1 Tax=Sphingomonas sp. JC676 TaxID=2768065 RepID=UPI00165868A1|nr:SapC family protein [Sphingomonas sp. JC676]MBC9032156.1 SapC family protein [Sphingomonas sp. JC676]
MSQPVLLNNVDHADLRVVLERRAAFGDTVNQAVVFPTEFEALQREYAILFRRDAAGAWRSTALLGLDADENLFLDGERWDANYIPALMQRGPFSIGLPRPGEPGEPMIHIDLEHPRISRNEGAPLFRDHGGNSPYLDQVSGVLQTIFVGDQAGPAMFAAFERANLLEPVMLDIELEHGAHYKIPDCYTVDAQRLAQLDGPALAALHRDDFLRCAIWQSSSLENIRQLAARKERRRT